MSPPTAATRAPRLHARFAPLLSGQRPSASQEVRRPYFLLQHNSIHSRNSTYISSLELTRIVSDRAALSSPLHVPGARGAHQQKGSPQPWRWYSPFTDQNFPPPGEQPGQKEADVKRGNTRFLTCSSWDRMCHHGVSSTKFSRYLKRTTQAF